MKLFLFVNLIANSEQFKLNRIKSMNRYYSKKYDTESDNLKRLSKYDEIRTFMNRDEGYGVLSTLANYKKIKDYPHTSVVPFSVDNNGIPIFCFSSIPKASKFGNCLASMDSSPDCAKPLAAAALVKVRALFLELVDKSF